MAKARTKLEKKIVQLSKELPEVTKDQLEYAKEKLFVHKATLLKSGILTCLDCAHQWKTKESQMTNVLLGVTCPKCKRKLEVEQTRRKVFGHSSYYQIIDIFKGYQVNRMFEIRKYWKAGKPQYFSCVKLFENWFTPEGEMRSVGLFVTSKWNECWGGDFKLRSSKSSTDYFFSLEKKYIYPKKKFIPKLKRRGVKTSTHHVNPNWLFVQLLRGNSKVETLFKAKQYDVLVDTRVFERYWPSLKICMRNNYEIKDARMWSDYLSLLDYFNKDLRSPKYVCPENLHKEHDKYMEKKRKADEKRDLEERIAKAIKDEKIYKKTRSKYMGLSFAKDDIEISFMNSVKQLAEESTKLHHCAFTNGFHKKENILMFSVRVNGELKATAAVNIKGKKVQELRGQNNWMSEHNTKENMDIGKRATKLLQDNMITIINGRKPKRKSKTKKQKMNLQVA